MSRVNNQTFDYQLEQLESRSDDHYAQAKFEILIDWLRDSPPLRILNAGCGLGELSLMLARLGHTVVGIDLEPDFVTLARRGAGARGLTSCQFELCALENFHSDEPFDVVAATDVLEHIEDDRAAMAHLATLVKPGGKIFIAVPAGQWLFGFHDRALGHYRRYSARSLRQLASPYCSVDTVRYFGTLLIPVALLYRRLLQRAYPLASTGQTKHPWRASAVRMVMGLERCWAPPLGTSVLLKGHRP